MARDRLQLQNVLVDILGSNNVYFSPPDGFELCYPCIIYKIDFLGSNYADNRRYIKRNRYSITVIDYDPDSEIPTNILEIPSAYFEDFFTSNNLNHWLLSLYF